MFTSKVESKELNMKKRFFLLTALLFVSFASYAKETTAEDIFFNYGGTVEEKQFIIKAGVGVDFDFIGASLYIPPVGLSAEYTVKCGVAPLGFGLELDYAHRTITGHSYYDYKYFYNNWHILTFANYHINVPVEKLDVYAGLKIGALIHSYQYTYAGTTTDSSGVYGTFEFGAVAGATWYFSEAFGVNLELGYPFLAKASATFKF